MSFLDKNIMECLSAKVTDLGRQRISEGNFNITFFKVGDSEFDYNFGSLDQYVTVAVEGDLDLKYPLLMDTVTNLDYGTVSANHSSRTVTEDLLADNTWKLNIPWTQKPAGLDSTYENLSGYGSNAYASIKEYLGYTSDSGQTPNDSTTYRNSMGDIIVVPPHEQKTIAVIHYSGQNYDTYEDYIAHDADAQSKFKLTIPNILYHRSSGTTIGYTFLMSASFGYIQSAKNKSATLGDKFHYLVDGVGNHVGKIFVYKRIIIIDDEEIVAALSVNAKRTWTLPAPRVNYVPLDLPCNPATGASILSGTAKDAWVTYILVNPTQASSGMHCNYYRRLPGIAGEYNISLKFGSEFSYLNSNSFQANKLLALIQVVDSGQLPSPDSWTAVDITSQLHSYSSGNITASNIVGYQFVVTEQQLAAGNLYELPNYIGAQPLENGGQGSGQFGDEAALPGTVTATRATNIHTMEFLVNLPDTQFNTSQNPTMNADQNARVTEIGLYNTMKELLVISKASHPHERIGFQQFSVQIDF